MGASHESRLWIVPVPVRCVRVASDLNDLWPSRFDSIPEALAPALLR